MPKNKPYLSQSISLIVCLVLFSGCGLSSSTQADIPPVATIPLENTVTPAPTSTTSPKSYGSAENPYVIGEIIAPESVSQTFANYLSENTGHFFSEVAFNDYSQLVDSVRLGKVALAWLPPITYLFLHQEVGARPLLLTNQNGAYFYGSQFYAAADSSLSNVFDQATDQNNPNTDLTAFFTQLQGLRPCFVSNTSVSGYLLPTSLIISNNITTEEPVFTQSHASVIRSLYTKGICDFGATFAHIGDPRTSSSVLSDLPDAAARIPIIYRSDPIIPNANLSAFETVTPEFGEMLIPIILEYSKSDSGLETLRASTGYNISSLMSIDDSAYNPLREVLIVTNFNPGDGIGY